MAVRVLAVLLLLNTVGGRAWAEERLFAEVVAYRAGSLTAPLHSFTLILDGRPVAAMPNGSFVTLPLAPGTHQFTIADSTANWSRALESNTRYYLRLRVEGSNLEPELTLEQAVPATAKIELEDLRELEPGTTHTP